MNLSCKAFKDLSVSELHRIMMSRCTVFVVEQHNPCQEIDETDAKCFHLWLEDDGQILSYARVFQDSDGISHIGRVLSTVRGEGYGARIMEAAIEACHKYLGWLLFYWGPNVQCLTFTPSMASKSFQKCFWKTKSPTS